MGMLHPAATAGVSQASQILAGLGNLETATTGNLLAAVTAASNALLPYYATAQGRLRAVRASDSAGARGMQSRAEYIASAEGAKANLVAVVNELLRRGVTYEALGRLPVSGDWAMESLDAGGTPLEMLKRSPRAGALILEGAGLAGRFLPGIVGRAPAPEGGWSMPSPYAYDPADLLGVALGSSMRAPDRETHASGLMTSMYGGPLWTALARMGVSDPTIQQLIASYFDPWVLLRTWPSRLPASTGPAGDPLFPGSAPAP